MPACGQEELIAQSLVDKYADHFGSGVGTSPELFGRFARPNSTTGQELEAVNWNVSAVGAVGAGLAFALVLLFGGVALAARQVGREQTA